MAFNFNGNTPKKILYNGLNVAKLIYNGVVVWMSEVLATIEGILPLTLTNSTGDDLVGYKIYGNSEYEGLPDGYTQVEYIESTGTQYIDTGIKTNTTTSRYETKISPSLVSGAFAIFGTRNSSSTNQSSMNVFIINGTFRLDWLYGAIGNSVRNISSNTEYAISITRGLATINNVNYRSGDTTSIDGSYTFYIGNFNNVGSVYSKGFSGKIYYSKLYNNNILVFDGVPCYRKSDNEIGMYDLVSNTFFTNAGKGTFNAGSVVSKKSVGDLVTDTSDVNYGKYKIPVLTNSHTTNIYLNKPLRKTSKLPTGYTQVEYLESTGTQYIDTNFIPNQDTRIKVKIMTKDISGMTNKTVFGSRESANSKHYGVTMGNGSQNSWWTGYGTSSICANRFALRDTLYEIEKNKNVTILNGSNGSVIAKNQSQTFTCPSNLYLFCMNQSGPTFYSNIELYSCKIWDNDVLIRNFIPCKNPSNEIGMYDLVNNVFYTNAGTGSFVAGAEVETVYYTDYLDYENQKVVRNVDDNDKGIDTSIEESVVLPAVPTDEGTTVFDVDTDVTPSYAEVKYYKNDV